MPDNIINRKITYLFSFLIPLCIFAGLYVALRLYPLSDNTILYSDMNNQFVSFYTYFKNIFTTNDNFIYTFYKNLGGDMVGFSAYYLTNPFLFILFLFPYKIMPLGIFIMEALMLSMAGLTFQIYLTNVYKKSSLLFSTSYALMGYVFVYFTLPIYFCNIILLPIVIYGFHRMMNEDYVNLRSSLLYIITLAASIITNYYIGYMLCLFLVIYFVYYCISEGGFNMRMLMKFAINSILSVMLTCFYLVPIAMSLKGQKNAPDASIMSLQRMFKLTGLIRNLLPLSYNGDYSNASLPNIYVGIIPVICIILFLVSKKVSLRKKAAALFLILSMVLCLYARPLNIIWHAFNEPVGFSHRFAFYLSFVLISVGFSGFIEGEGALLTFIQMRVANRELKDNRLSDSKKLVNIICICVLAFSCLELSLNAYHSLRVQNAKPQSGYAEFYDNITPVLDKIKAGQNPDDLYRIEKDIQYTMEDSMAFSYIGLTHNSSCETETVKNFMGKLGFRNQGIWAFYNQGSTAFADSFLGVKYFVSRFDSTEKEYELISSENELYTMLNKNALALASVVDKDLISSVNMENENLFEIQNEIAKSYRFEKDLYSEASISEIRKTPKAELSDDFITHANKAGAIITEIEEGQTLKEGSTDSAEYVEFDVSVNDKRRNLYLYFTAPKYQPGRIYVNGIDWDDYFSDYRWAIEKVGRFKPGDTVTIRVEGTDSLNLSDFYLYFEDIDAIDEWKACADAFLEDEVSLKKISSSHIKGTVNAKENGTLLFSMPFDTGWNVTIDGKKVPIYESLSALMSIDLQAGEHIIEMRYVPRGIFAGAALSLISLIILVFMGKSARRK